MPSGGVEMPGTDSPPFRPRLRIHIRTLMGLVVFFGVYLGWAVSKARVQSEAVKAIQGAGGQTMYAWEWEDGVPTFGDPWVPRCVVNLVGIDYFGPVAYVCVGSRAGAAAFLQVGRLGGLRGLDISWSRVDKGDLAHLVRLTGLERFSLNGTKIGDGAIVHLKGLKNLRALYLSRTRVGNGGLFHLRGLRRLEVLDLEHTHVSDAGLAYLEGLSGLRELNLGGTRVTDGGVDRLRSSLPAIRITR